MDIHWIMVGSNGYADVHFYFMDMIKDGRGARFYYWYPTARKARLVRNENEERNWIMVF